MTAASKLLRASVVLVVSLSYLAHVFQFSSGELWKSGLGDWIDPYFINFLPEHWYHSFWSLTDPSSPPMYFPVRHTLGYSHGLILYVPFYLAVRPALHPFVAYNVALLLVIESGIVCLYLVFRKFAGLSVIEALALSAFFFTSQNVINGGTGVWSQRASVFLIPSVLLLALVSARMPEGRLRLALACLSGLLSALLFPQDFPTAAFALLLVVLTMGGPLLRKRLPDLWMRKQDTTAKAALAIAALAIAWGGYVSIIGGIDVRIAGVRIASDEWHRPVMIAAVLVAFVLFRGRIRVGSWGKAFVAGATVGLLVFLWIYLPAYREHHAFPEDELINSLTQWDPDRWRDAYETFRPFEFVFMVGILLLIPWFKIDRSTRLYALWFLFVSFIVLLVPLRFGGFSIWRTLLEWLPGFSAIRDPRRLIYVYELVVVLVTSLLMRRLSEKRASRAVVTVIVLVLLATEWNRAAFAFQRPTAVYDRWVEMPIDIDPSCRSFFIKGASQEYMSRSPHMWALYGVDSMFIALKVSIPTLNGYSAWQPTGWELANPQESNHSERVDRWIERHSLMNVCVFDIDRRTMRPYVTRAR